MNDPFLNKLVGLITGFYIAELPADRRQRIVQECLNFFMADFLGYISDNYDKNIAQRAEAFFVYPNPNYFQKYPEMTQVVQSGINNFWQLVGKQNQLNQN